MLASITGAIQPAITDRREPRTEEPKVARTDGNAGDSTQWTPQSKMAAGAAVEYRRR